VQTDVAMGSLCWSGTVSRVPEDQRGSYPFLPDVPRHVQIADVLRQQIRGAKLAPRMPIPSESYLTAEFGVSRDTARKAVAILREEGYVHTVPGMGTFVRPRDEWPTH
jgi:GntR family transcriptional regulator